MNAPIVRLFAVLLVLFGVLVAFTSWWTVFAAEDLRTNAKNRRTLLAEERIKRGRITVAGGTTAARSVPLRGERWGRRYPTGPRFAHAVGYSDTTLGRTGLEQYYNDKLTGRRSELIGVVESLLSSDPVGDDLRSALRPAAQQVALEALGERRGAVVALDVDTGGVLVLASTPTYDPDGLDVAELARLNRDKSTPLVNRATQSRYPPGSTMKVVTAAAALDSGKFTPQSTVSGENGKRVSGVPLNNFGRADYGQVDLTTALTKSVNTAWASVAEQLGARTMREYMERFGFYADPPMDYPDEQMVASGVVKGRRGLVPPTSRLVDVGRMAIGQGDLLATPLQMAMVAQTVANDGVRLKPWLVTKVVDPDGRTVQENDPERAARVMSEESANQLETMMKAVVSEGSGTAAALEGVAVAGKTGTAELNTSGLNQPWFICFTDRFAVSVTVERVQGGLGGTDAAPIAKRVLQALGE
jgi:peptidoglycan glycosyltransferase